MENSFGKIYNKEVRPILDIMDRVREQTGSSMELDVPSIIVIGDQSAGKSSTLENISQILLPKGEGCVTRCPLIIQLRALGEDQQESVLIRLENDDKDPEMINDLSKVDKYVEKYTQRLLDEQPEGTMLVERPIYLTIFNKQMINLTLIDLPGLTYENQHFIDTNEKLIKKYVRNENAIILLVTASTQDIHTTQATQFCNQVDSKRERTIQVVTKIDQIQPGKVNQFYDYQGLGIVAVQNRSNIDIGNGLSIDQSREQETILFNTHQELSTLSPEMKGINQLIYKLMVVQKDKLLSSKQHIKDRLINKQQEVIEELIRLPDPCHTDTQKSIRFKQMLNNFKNQMSRLYIQDRSGFEGQNQYNIRANLDELSQKHYDYCNSFINEKILNQDMLIQILNEVTGNKGYDLPNFDDSKIFTQSFRKLIPEIYENSIQYVKDAKNLIFEFASNLIKKNFSQFQQLQDEIINDLQEYYDKVESKFIEQSQQQYKKDKQVIMTKNLLYLDIIQQYENQIQNNGQGQQHDCGFGQQHNSGGFGQQHNSGIGISQKIKIVNREIVFVWKKISIQSQAYSFPILPQGYVNGVNKFSQKVLYSLASYFDIFYRNHCDTLFNNLNYDMLYTLQDMYADELDSRFNPIGSINSKQTLKMMEENQQITYKREKFQQLSECLRDSISEVSKLR